MSGHALHGRSPARPADVETSCTGYGCRSSDLVPGAPAPLCRRCLRRTYEFAAAMVAAATGGATVVPINTHRSAADAIAAALYERDTGQPWPPDDARARADYEQQAATIAIAWPGPAPAAGGE